MRLIFSLALSLLFTQAASAALDPVLEAADLRLPEAPALREAAESKKPKRRSLAAAAWGRIMSPKGIDPLLRLTKDQLPFVREAAAFALGQLGWQEENAGGRLAEIQSALSALLQDKQLSVRVAATEALGKVALARAPELLGPSLSAKEAALRAEAVMGIFRSRMILKLRNPSSPPGELPEELRKSLEALASEKDSSVRLNVAYFFARNSEPKAESAITALLRDKNKWTRLFAATALGKMKAKGAKDPLLAATADADYQVRLAALSALLAAGNSALDAPALAGDKLFHVRAAFAAGLSAEKGTELEVLRSLASDESATVRAETLKALAKAHKEDLLDWLRAQELGAHWLVREAAVQSLGDSASEAERIAFLSDHLTDPEINVRAAALEALLALPGEATFTQLRKALDSEELAIRGTAVAALKDRKETEGPSLAWKTYNDSLETKWVEMREELVEVFEKTSNEDTTAHLRSLLQDPAGSVRAKARKALETRGVGELPVYPEPALSRSPHRDLSFKRAPFVELETSRGRVVLETFPEAAPVHVADLVGNVKAGYYDGLSWHRVVSNFVIQGGDPEGSGWGGAGYALRAEINPNRFLRGALGMPRSAGFDTGGSQLFFSLLPTPHLDGQYTVYGQVVEGAEVLDRLERGDRIVKARIVHRK